MANLLLKKSLKTALQQGGSKSLKKTLGTFDLTMLGIGAIIGTGIMVLTGIVAAQNAGPAVTVSFILSAALCGLVALCYAEVGTTIPVSGSVYAYSYVAIGEFIAHLMGWSLIALYILTGTTVAGGWTGYLNSLLEGFGIYLPSWMLSVPSKGGIMNLPSVVIVLFMTWVLSRGTAESKRVNNAMVLVKIGVILLFCIVGIFYVKPANWVPFSPFGLNGILSGSAALIFAFIGFDAIATSAEEVKNPQKSLPVGILGSLAICTFFYVAVCLIMTGMVSYTQLNVAEAMSFVLNEIGQNAVAGIIAIGAIIGMMAVIFANLYASTRVLFAMSRDGLMPKVFSRMNTKRSAPVASTWIVGCVSATVAGFVDLKSLADMANISALLTFMVLAAIILILRKTHPDIKRGFKMPFVPLFPSLSIVFCLLLMLKLPPFIWLAFSVWLLIGTLVYFGYSQKNSFLYQSFNRFKENHHSISGR